MNLVKASRLTEVNGAQISPIVPARVTFWYLSGAYFKGVLSLKLSTSYIHDTGLEDRPLDY